MYKNLSLPKIQYFFWLNDSICNFNKLNTSKIKYILEISKSGIRSQILLRFKNLLLLHKKWSFPLRISPVNMTKSTGNCGLVTFTEEILDRKLHFLCSVFWVITEHPEQFELGNLQIFGRLMGHIKMDFENIFNAKKDTCHISF